MTKHDESYRADYWAERAHLHGRAAMKICDQARISIEDTHALLREIAAMMNASNSQKASD